VTFNAEFWFDADDILFGIQRTKYYLSIPVSSSLSFFIKDSGTSPARIR